MQEVPVDKLVKGQVYYIQNRYTPRDKQIGEFVHNKYSTPLFKISNIRKKNGKILYNGQQGEFGRSASLSVFFKPRKEEIINQSLQRQALKQTLSTLAKNKDKEVPEDIEIYTGEFLLKNKASGFKKYNTMTRRYANKRKNNKTKKI
jgi:hypothetical protein